MLVSLASTGALSWMGRTTCCWSMQIEGPWNNTSKKSNPLLAVRTQYISGADCSELWELWSPYTWCSRATLQRLPTHQYFKGTEASPHYMEIMLMFLGGIKISNLPTSS